MEYPHAKPWIERQYGECAYPAKPDGADTWSCAAPTDPGETYCPARRLRMYVPAKPLRPRVVRAA